MASARAVNDAERAFASQRWAELQAENAPFRIVSAGTLVSAPIDVFDNWLLSRVGPEPRGTGRLVAEAMVLGDPQYHQVGNIMLFARLSELAERGELVVHGDPEDLWSARVSRA